MCDRHFDMLTNCLDGLINLTARAKLLARMRNAGVVADLRLMTLRAAWPLR
jgi:hypothetical protein